MGRRHFRKGVASFSSLALLGLMTFALAGCGSSSSSTGMGTANVTMSDPPVNSQYSEVWVTVDGVEASVSTSDTGWVPLVSNLNSQSGSYKAVQLNLLDLPTFGTNSNCLLALLGSGTSLPAGNYQQIRLQLVPNNATNVTLLPYHGETTPSGGIPNECASASAWNCALPNTSGASEIALQLSSQAQTGLKIPPGQVMGGPIDVAQGSTVDINIDFNADRSIVQEGPSSLRLDPVLVAYQTSQNLTGISGKVVAAGNITGTPPNLSVATGSALAGANITAEISSGGPKYNNDPVDLIGNYITTTDSSGNFELCPLPTGPLDLVASAGPTTGTTVYTYGPTIVTGVPNGAANITIPLVQQGTQATLTGTVTATSASGTTLVYADVYALQPNPSASSPTSYFAVPLLNNSLTMSTPSIAQIGLTNCTGTTTVTCTSPTSPTFSLLVPPATPLIGAYNTSAISDNVQWSQAPSTSNVSYTVEATCTPATTPPTPPDLIGAFSNPVSSVTTNNSYNVTPNPIRLDNCAPGN